MILEIWESYRRLPLWVQLWVAVILVPVNLATLLFLAEPYGGWIALMAVGGMAPNLLVMLRERGFSKTMALPHVLIWTPLVVLLIWLLGGPVDLSESYRNVLWLLLVVDLISLGFDYVDIRKWWQGDRGVA